MYTNRRTKKEMTDIVKTPAPFIGRLHQLLVRNVEGAPNRNELDDIVTNAFRKDQNVQKILQNAATKWYEMTPDTRAMAYGTEFSNKDVNEAVDPELFRIDLLELIKSSNVGRTPDVVVPSEIIGRLPPPNNPPETFRVPSPPDNRTQYEMKFVGVRCLLETTSEPVYEGGSDEPYIFWVGYDWTNKRSWSLAHPVDAKNKQAIIPWSDIDQDESIYIDLKDAPTVFGPVPNDHGGLLVAIMMERDQGLQLDPVITYLEDALKVIADTAHWLTIFQPAKGMAAKSLAQLIQESWDYLKKSGLLNWFLQFPADELIGLDEYTILRGGLKYYADRPITKWQGHEYHWWLEHSDLWVDGGGYYVSFYRFVETK